MSEIITPLNLWKNFNDRLEVMPVTLGERAENGVKFEYVNFSGRDTGMGRVTIFGVLASKELNPSHECVLMLLDSLDKINENLLAYFVNKGYSVLCVDYGGKRDGVERFTQYPENVNYANALQCGRHKDFVDETADKTCWYEWVAVGVYAYKFLKEKMSTDRIGLIGVRDGGEVAWKLATLAEFSCAIVIGACGWRAYRGMPKFQAQPGKYELNDERYRFIAGIDSQAYAPYVKCPMQILCPTGDATCEYDRAFDTFSRINPKYAHLSFIAYSVNCGSVLDMLATRDMFMFLDSHVKKRNVFLPKPLEIEIGVDGEENLIAHVKCDPLGIIEKCGIYLGEDCYDFATRDWVAKPLKRVINPHELEFLLNVYEKTSAIFVLGFATYSNGLTVWSKVNYKLITGNFKNSGAKSNLLYTSNFGTQCISVADCSKYAVGGLILTDDDVLPKIIKIEGLFGIHSKCGLLTNRIKSLQFSPDKESIFKLDVCSEEDIILEVSLRNTADGLKYSVKINILGGVWQSLTLRAKAFKNANGVSLGDFTKCEGLAVTSDGKFALNNLIWL